MSETRIPLRTRAGSAIGLTACVAAVVYGVYHWFDALTYPAIGNHLSEVALHEPDYVSLSDTATFAASLIVAVVLYCTLRFTFDRDVRRKTRITSRKAITAIRQMPRLYAEFIHNNPEEAARQSTLTPR